jgi:hypothetical protein
MRESKAGDNVNSTAQFESVFADWQHAREQVEEQLDHTMNAYTYMQDEIQQSGKSGAIIEDENGTHVLFLDSESELNIFRVDDAIENVRFFND